jgi:hypothetical protein
VITIAQETSLFILNPTAMSPLIALKASLYQVTEESSISEKENREIAQVRSWTGLSLAALEYHVGIAGAIVDASAYCCFP